MKVVIFAHTPPPHHGQSYMVQLMVDGFSKNPQLGVQIFHVNAQFATDIQDIGKFRAGKITRIFKYCAQALWHRFRHGAHTLYYIPAPPLKNTVIRDWIILIFCRPFFSHTILHWHAGGLAEWLDSQRRWIQTLTHRALGRSELSIALTGFNQTECQRFNPQKTVVVPNGIPDPCPNFATILAGRRARQTSSAKPRRVQILYMALGMKEKGIFDAIEGVFQANAAAAAAQLLLEFSITIAGKFFAPQDEETFAKILRESDQAHRVQHIGFIEGAAKSRLLAESDIFCFPTYYFAENLPVVLLEAMAYGLPIITTQWRALPELLPENYPGIVQIKSPNQIAAALLELAQRDDAETLRQRFLENYTLDRHLAALARAFHETSGA